MKKLRNKRERIALLCALILQAEKEKPGEEFIPDYNFIKPFLKGLKPIRRIALSEWAEAYRILGRAVSKIDGPWRNHRTPYLVPIMNALSVFSSYQHVIVMKGTQVGATSIVENWVGYCIHINPSPILLMYPTLGVAKKNSKRRYASLISDSPVLRNIVSTPKSRDGSNTILEKDFPGGNMMFCGAESPNDIRSVNIRYVGFDEIDEYPIDLADQGDPIEIALKRTATYDDNKKVVYISTPKTKGTSHIEKLFNETDQNYIYLPCPHCAPNMPVTGDNWDGILTKVPLPGYQKLVLDQFRFTDGNPAAVYYECIHCKKEIHNHHKHYMLPRYRCMADEPEKANPKRIGFHINAFYSALGFYSWETMAEDYEKAKKDPVKMKTFVQTTLGLPYEEEGQQPKYMELFARNCRGPYSANQIPDEVCFLTAGVDVQKDRIEIEIVGWGKGRRSYSIDYRVLFGSPVESAVWGELANILSETWIRESDGFIFGLNMTLIDEGYSKNEVYSFCLQQGLSRILPSKGMETQTIPISAPQPVYITREGKKEASLRHITISTDFYKSALYAHLGLTPTDETQAQGPELSCFFPKTYQLEHYKRLTAEKKVTLPGIRGFDKALWKKEYPRNEQLDCRVYAMAAAEIMGISRFTDVDFDIICGRSIETKPTEEKKVNKARLGGISKLPKIPKHHKK